MDVLNQKNWVAYFELTPIDDAQADCDTDYPSRMAIFRLNNGENSSPPEELAKHEVLEGLLLGRLRAMAEERTATTEEIEAEVHGIVRILEKVL